MKTVRKAKREQDAVVLANAQETVRAFAALADALERRMLRAMDSKDGTPEKDRVQRAIIDGLLAPGPGGAWMSAAHHRLGLTWAYWGGLFKHEANQTSVEKGAARLFETEPDHVGASLMAGAACLAPVLGALADELTAADADIQFRQSQKTRRAA